MIEQGLDGGTLADHPHLLGRLLGHLPVGREQLPAILGVFQRHCRVGGKFHKPLFVLLAERSAQFVDQLELAEQFALTPTQRHT